ncbi:MAG: SDR family NAD(P)-dependent oxidoreductase [Verrucomicrobiia bacterium]|jgi:glucose 1-dehydrogenase
MDLSGKIALVTGGGRGIGRGCALELARNGADLVINDRPGSPDLADAAGEIRALGRQCTPIENDVFSRTGCEQLVAATLEAVGRIDILISNPAFGKRAAFLDIDPVEFDRVIDATFKSGFHLSQIVARHMVARGGGGKIIFISSVQAEMPFARNAPYGAAKAALNHFSQTVSVELARHRINANAIEPGWIDTPAEHATFSAEVIAEEGQKLPWGRMGTPADIGKAAAFLASDDADYITGAVIPVDGGFRFKDLQADELPDELRPS